jgi:hypothetical protein
MSEKAKTVFSKAIDLAELKKSPETMKRKLKAILTADFTTNTGADLPPEQANEYIDMILGESDFLKNQCTFTNVGNNLRGELPRQHLGDPVTEAGIETETTAEVGTKPTYDALTFNCLKTKVRRHISIDALHIAAIGYDTIEEALLGGVLKRAAIDKQQLAFNGDPTTYAGAGDAWGKLFAINEGWRVLADRCHVLDAEGALLDTDIVFSALDAFPEELMNDNVSFIGNRKVHRDFVRLAAAKAGGSVLSQAYFAEPKKGLDYFMVEAPYLPVSSIPKSAAVSTTVATPAQVKSELRGPWQIATGTNAAFDIDVQGVNIAGNLTNGLRSAQDIATDLNAAWTAAAQPGSVAREYDGFVLITTPLTGVARTIVVNNVANSFYLTVSPGATQGIVVATTTTGSDAGTAGTQYEGSYMILTDPKNLHYVQSTDIRMTVRYWPDNDSMQIIIYEYCDFLIEDTNALVLVKNIRANRTM